MGIFRTAHWEEDWNGRNSLSSNTRDQQWFMVYGVLYTANISLTSYALMAFGSGFARYWFLAQQRHRLLLERDRVIESVNCIFLL
jgi:hypothetical protein